MPGFADDIGKLTPHLRRFARALVRGNAAQRADDLVQETIVLAARADLPKRGPKLTAWCFAALIRLNRARNRAPVTAADPSDAPLPFLPKDILRLDALPLDLREVLLLVTLAGFAYPQVAGILDIEVDLVIARLTQARDALTRTNGAGGLGQSGRGAERRQNGAIPYLRLVK